MKLFNKKTDSNIPGDAVYVGRGSPLGNPYVIGVDGDRSKVIADYEVYLNKAIDRQDPFILMALNSLTETSGLICFCTPAPCHGRVIEKVWRERIQSKPEERSIYYAGIGSRETPEVTLRMMTIIAKRLDVLGFVVRSGHADGADHAFESCVKNKEIYLPWRGFNGSSSRYDHPSLDAMRLAALLHPGWDRLKNPGRKLIARNGHQILGETLRSPVDFVVCWTPDGAEQSCQRTPKTGGTGQAIDLASRMGIPVFNLKNKDAMARLSERVKSNPIYLNQSEAKASLSM